MRSHKLWIGGMLLGLVLRHSPLPAAALDGVAQARIRAATFEVVQLKPDEGAVTYERPLPLELLPYQERIDKYRSIGTAFALGKNRYLTAGHVIAAGFGSQFGPPALRDPAGHVYAIDQVLKYLSDEDFVEFSLQQQPKDVEPLDIGPRPMPGDPMFAVGNALGEGIVIRDGVFTSETPEELNGKWKWLRFSAAASPGNSGGPLLDQSGRVVGIVLRKSESENLNYALSMDEVNAIAEGEGRLRSRSVARLTLLDNASQTVAIDEKIALPRRLADFYKAVNDIIWPAAIGWQRQLLSKYQDRVFPRGDGSAQLLASAPTALVPVTLHEQQDGQWFVPHPGSRSFDLGDNGTLELTQDGFRLRIPDSVKLAALYGDSKLFMDLILKGSPLQRTVGSDSVRITSLGKAQRQSTFTDGYGRVWYVDVWPIPYLDYNLVAFSMPTPEGYAGSLLMVNSGLTDATLELGKLFADFVYVTFDATLSQWQDYLAQPGMRAKAFDAIKLDIDADKHVTIKTKRLELDATSDLIALNKGDHLSLNFSFYQSGNAVVWDLQGISLREDQQKTNGIGLSRISRPTPALPQRFQDVWSQIQATQFPYNGSVISADGSTRVELPVTLSGVSAEQASFRYLMSVVKDGEQPQDVMTQKLELMRQSSKITDH